MSEISSPMVYAAINAVQAKLATEGISKSRTNEQQKYKFRGIDDVYNALSRALADAHLCILPRVTHREVTERPSKSGGVLFYVVCDVEFDFVSADDGSKHTVRTSGEAMDSGDKATNKAMSAAYKYACMQAFCIPTEGDNDADATTHEVASGLDGNAEADLMASLDEATNAEELRERTKKALAVAHEGGDVEAHKRIKARAVKIAEQFKATVQ